MKKTQLFQEYCKNFCKVLRENALTTKKSCKIFQDMFVFCKNLQNLQYYCYTFCNICIQFERILRKMFLHNVFFLMHENDFPSAISSDEFKKERNHTSWAL